MPPPGSVYEPLTLFIRYFRLRLSRHVLWARGWFLYIPRSHLSRPLYFYTVITGAFLALDHSNLSNSGSFPKIWLIYQVLSVSGSNCLCSIHWLGPVFGCYISAPHAYYGPIKLYFAQLKCLRLAQRLLTEPAQTSSDLITISFYSLLYSRFSSYGQCSGSSDTKSPPIFLRLVRRFELFDSSPLLSNHITVHSDAPTCYGAENTCNIDQNFPYS